MKTLSEKLIGRNYKKRFIVIIITAAALLLVSVGAVAALTHTQISEAISLEKEYEQQEKLTEGSGAEREEGGKREEAGFEGKITPLPTASIVVLCALAAIWVVLALFYWVSVMEWLYKMAAKNGLNRALWPILGGVANIIAVLAMLIIVNDPKRRANNA